MKNKQEIKQYAREIRAALNLANHAGHVLQSFISSHLVACSDADRAKYRTLVIHELEALGIALLDAGAQVVELHDLLDKDSQQ